MMQLLQSGPIHAQFDIYEDFFWFDGEAGEIYKHTFGDKEGVHSVEVIGYGVSNGVKYWSIKNSYGEQWGNDGYFWMQRGDNSCGIESTICYRGW